MIKYIVVIFVFLFIVIQLTSQNMFECNTAGKGTRFLFLHFQNNATILSTIQNASGVDPNLKTYIVIHGWMEYPTTHLNLKLAKTIARNEPSNVIVMDYSKWSRKFYSCAKNIVVRSAIDLSEFITNAANNSYINLDKVHLIGFSLGAHVAGLGGRMVACNLNESIHRITALDPAGPLFTEPTKEIPEVALKRKDAVVVDVLHTTSLIGTWVPLGTADFYAIGPFDTVGPIVSVQPACIEDLNSCSHIIARKYYIESITSCGIKGDDTDDENRLVTYGHHMPDDTEGIFEFEPEFSSPFGTYPRRCNATNN